MTDQVPTHPGPMPGKIVVTDGATADRHRLALEKLKALRAAVQQRRERLDADHFETFLQRTPEVREAYATEALDEMFDWYEEYVAQRAAIDHDLEALAVVERWAEAPGRTPEALADLEVAGVAEEEPAAPGLTRPFRPLRPVRPLLIDPLNRPVAFGAAVADTQQLRADLHREVAEVVPRVLASELDARLPILIGEQLRGIGAITPIGGKYTPDTPVQSAPAIEPQRVPVGAAAEVVPEVTPSRAASHATSHATSHASPPRRSRR